MKAKTTTASSQVQILELCNTLSRNLTKLQKSQHILMPDLAPLLENNDDQDEIKLWLPSELPNTNRDVCCLPGIPQLEFHFCYTQADNSLAKIRCLCHLFQGLVDQSSKHTNPQQSVTRAKAIFDGFQARIQSTVKEYLGSYSVMQALDPSEQLNPGWTKCFQPLEDVDIRGPSCKSYEKSEGGFQPSWIWLIPRLANDTVDGNSTQKESLDSLANDTMDGNSAQKESSESLSTANPDPGLEELQVAESMRVHWEKCQAQADH